VYRCILMVRKPVPINRVRHDQGTENPKAQRRFPKRLVRDFAATGFLEDLRIVCRSRFDQILTSSRDSESSERFST
jgi:hypothetical protein